MIDDPGVRAEFSGAPMDYLGRHGYESLDAADVREALMIMADGAPTTEAVQLHAGGEAIDAAGGDGLAGAAAGLGSALGAMTATEVDIDPADLDGLDDAEAVAGEDGAVEAADDADAGTDDADDTTVAADASGEGTGPVHATLDDAQLDVDDLAEPDVSATESGVDRLDVDEPGIDDAPFASPPDSTQSDTDGLDDWGDVV